MKKICFAVDAEGDLKMDDTISRRAAVSAFTDLLIWKLKGERLPTWNDVYHTIKDIPSAQPEPPRAYWIRGKYSWDDYHYNDASYKCSRCGKVDANIPRYCPGCGAKMEEEIR